MQNTLEFLKAEVKTSVENSLVELVKSAKKAKSMDDILVLRAESVVVAMRGMGMDEELRLLVLLLTSIFGGKGIKLPQTLSLVDKPAPTSVLAAQPSKIAVASSQSIPPITPPRRIAIPTMQEFAAAVKAALANPNGPETPKVREMVSVLFKPKAKIPADVQKIFVELMGKNSYALAPKGDDCFMEFDTALLDDFFFGQEGLVRATITRIEKEKGTMTPGSVRMAFLSLYGLELFCQDPLAQRQLEQLSKLLEQKDGPRNLIQRANEVTYQVSKIQSATVTPARAPLAEVAKLKPEQRKPKPKPEEKPPVVDPAFEQQMLKAAGEGSGQPTERPELAPVA